jgi:hypothetical protein
MSEIQLGNKYDLIEIFPYRLYSIFNQQNIRFHHLAFTTTAAESEIVNPARALSPLSPSSSFTSKHLYMKPSHSEDLMEQIKAVVDILLQTITARSKRK